MPDLLVVVLRVAAGRLEAALAEVDRPGEVVRESAAGRGPDLLADVPPLLARLEAGHLSDRLLSLAVAAEPDAGPQLADLRRALGSELPEGWGLPATLPVVHGLVPDWAAAGAPAGDRPLVAGAVVAAARAVGAHAHLPRGA